MPLEGEHEKDFGTETPDGPVCRFDLKDGKLKSPEEIFQGGIAFFADACAEGDRELAARLTVKNMKGLAYWQRHPFDLLSGPEATDEEFGVAMAKL